MKADPSASPIAIIWIVLSGTCFAVSGALPLAGRSRAGIFLLAQTMVIALIVQICPDMTRAKHLPLMFLIQLPLLTLTAADDAVSISGMTAVTGIFLLISLVLVTARSLALLAWIVLFFGGPVVSSALHLCFGKSIHPLFLPTGLFLGAHFSLRLLFSCSILILICAIILRAIRFPNSRKNIEITKED